MPHSPRNPPRRRNLVIPTHMHLRSDSPPRRSLSLRTPTLRQRRLPAAEPPKIRPRWYRGNMHTHSLWSDGNDFPEMIADWYRSHGYHFLALSDHNILSEGDRWMTHDEIVKRGHEDALAKYRQALRRRLGRTTRHAGHADRTRFASSRSTSSASCSKSPASSS